MKFSRRRFLHLADRRASWILTRGKTINRRILLGLTMTALLCRASFLAPARPRRKRHRSPSRCGHLISRCCTMAPDGAWGTATDPRINRAIYLAIGNCNAMSGAELGCGAYQTTVATAAGVWGSDAAEKISSRQTETWPRPNVERASARPICGSCTCRTCRHASVS